MGKNPETGEGESNQLEYIHRQIGTIRELIALHGKKVLVSWIEGNDFPRQAAVVIRRNQVFLDILDEKGRPYIDQSYFAGWTRFPDEIPGKLDIYPPKFKVYTL